MIGRCGNPKLADCGVEGAVKWLSAKSHWGAKRIVRNTSRRRAMTEIGLEEIGVALQPLGMDELNVFPRPSEQLRRTRRPDGQICNAGQSLGRRLTDSGLDWHRSALAVAR